MKSNALLLAMLAACAPAMAQTHMSMPEGSKDIYLTAGASYGPRAEGSKDMKVFKGAMLSAQWSNGVFINMNTVGIHLSDRFGMAYGLQITPTTSRVTTLTATGRESKSRFTPEVGGFFNYHIAHGLGLTSGLMYGGSADHRGLRMHVGLNAGMPVAEHHSVGVSGRVRLANRSSLQNAYGVTAAEQIPGVLPVHEVEGGVRDTILSAGWSWQVSNKYSLNTSLERRTLHGSAAASPRIEQASGVSINTALTYRF